MVDSVRKYAEQLADLDPDCLGVVVTHMDTVTWTRQQFSEALGAELGITGAVFSSADTAGPQLQGDVLALCRKRYKFSVDGENFFRLFKVRTIYCSTPNIYSYLFEDSQQQHQNSSQWKEASGVVQVHQEEIRRAKTRFPRRDASGPSLRIPGDFLTLASKEGSQLRIRALPGP